MKFLTLCDIDEATANKIHEQAQVYDRQVVSATSYGYIILFDRATESRDDTCMIASYWIDYMECYGPTFEYPYSEASVRAEIARSKERREKLRNMSRSAKVASDDP